MWVPAPAEIIDWFGWHDGPLGPGEGLRLGPSEFEPLGLEGAVWATAYLKAIAETLANSLGIYPGTPGDPEYFWDKNWLPLANRDPEWLVADLGHEADHVPVLTVAWDNDEFRTVRAESLSAMVETWLNIPDKSWSWVPEIEQWHTMTNLIPQELLASRLF